MSGCVGAGIASLCGKVGSPSGRAHSAVFEGNVRSLGLHRVCFSPQTKALLARRLSEAPCSLEYQKAILLYGFLSEVDLFSAFSVIGGRLRAGAWLSPTDFNFEVGLQIKLNQALGAYLESKGNSSRASFEVVDAEKDSCLLEISFI